MYVGVGAASSVSPAMLSISPNKMRQISDPIIDLLEQLHRIIVITQVMSSHSSPYHHHHHHPLAAHPRCFTT